MIMAVLATQAHDFLNRGVLLHIPEIGEIDMAVVIGLIDAVDSDLQDTKSKSSSIPGPCLEIDLGSLSDGSHSILTSTPSSFPW